VTELDTFGVGLQVSTEDGYRLIDGADTIVLHYQSDFVDADSFPEWAPVQAASDGNGGYTVLWQNDHGAAVVWDVDANGSFVAGSTIENVRIYEDVFQFDVDRDGSVGHVTTELDTVGVGLHHATADGYRIVDKDTFVLLTYQGDTVGANSFAGWRAVKAAENGKGGYSLLWESDAGGFVIWETAENGAHKTSFELTDFVAFEDRFQADLNGDGTVGLVAIA